MKLKMLTGLGGPKINLTRGDEHEFDDAEALRMVDAGLAIPTDPEAFAELKAKQGDPVEPETDAEKVKKDEEARKAAEENPDADLDAAKTHAQIDAIAATDKVTFAEDVKTVAAKVEAVREFRVKAREEAAKAAEQE